MTPEPGRNGDRYQDRSLADRLPPFNFEAETGVLGSVLCDPAVMIDVSDVVTPADFYRESHAAVWAEMLAMDAEGLPVDSVMLSDRLDRKKPPGLDGIDLLDFMAECASSVPHSVNAKYYADIVKQKAVSRELIETANAMLRDSYSDRFTAGQLLDSAERKLLKIADRTAGGDTVRVGNITPSALVALDARMAGRMTGLTSGLADLDDMTCGFRPENLIYLAARTSVGKTALAVNIIDHLACRQDRPVLLVTLEMTRHEIRDRLIILRTGLDGKLYNSGRISAADRAQVAATSARIAAAPLFIDDAAGRTVTQIAANARRHKARESIEILVIDLINHIAGEDERKDRREQMALISRRLKWLARELEIPVLVLAQINRKPEEREGKRPRKSDIKDCGNLEEDADQVLILHRHDYYKPTDRPGEALVIVDKNRNAPTGDVRVVFDKSTMRFDNLARVPDQDGPAF